MSPPSRTGPEVDEGAAGHDERDRRRGRVVEFDLHGLAGIRLVGASPSDAAGVARQLGPMEGTLQGPADVTVRFVRRLPTSTPVRYLGWNDAGFTDDTFLVFRSRRGGPVTAQIAFDQIGRGCEIICQSGSGVPLLIPLVNLTVLAKGVIPVHASAFSFGNGVLVTGWAKGGKTEALLGFMSRGAQYIGDEWIYVRPDRGRLYGIPEPIKVWEWHLEDLPQYRAAIPLRDRVRLRSLGAFKHMERVMPRAPRKGSTLSRAMGGAMSLVDRRRFVHIPPATLFGRQSCVLEGALDKIFLVVSRESPEVTVEPADPEEVARRIVFSMQYERLDFLSYYYKFRFAFPHAETMDIEQTMDIQLKGLLEAFAGKEAYVVYHPFPAPIVTMADAMAPFID